MGQANSWNPIVYTMLHCYPDLIQLINNFKLMLSKKLTYTSRDRMKKDGTIFINNILLNYNSIEYKVSQHNVKVKINISSKYWYVY